MHMTRSIDYFSFIKKEKTLVLQTPMVNMLLISPKEADQELAAVEEQSRAVN